jgi:hypothetical protein
MRGGARAYTSRAMRSPLLGEVKQLKEVIKMKDALKLISGYLIVTVVAFFAGSLVALNIRASPSCYFEGKFGKDITFKIGKNKITDFDLKKIDNVDAIELCAKIMALKYDDVLSDGLRRLRDQSIGPFTEKDIDLYVQFVENDHIGNQMAQACRGELLNKQLNIFEIIEPSSISLKISEMRDFSVLGRQHKAYCADTAFSAKTIWINREAASKWLKTDKELLPDKLKARASIVRNIVTLPDKLMSHFSEQLISYAF